MIRRRFACAIAATVLALSLWAVPAQACPMCAESLPNGSSDNAAAGSASGQAAPQGNLAQGVYYSILFMLAIPYGLAGTVGGVIYWQYRKRVKLALPAAQSLPAAAN